MARSSSSLSCCWPGVVLREKTPPVAQTLQNLCTRLGLDPAVLGAAMGKVTRGFGTTDLMEPLDTPLATEAEWLDRLRAVLAEDAGVRFELTSLGPVWFDGRETRSGPRAR